mmetsp:Transcript_1348/g.2096  ORF Transcript_1348/g.2096 Transcript_1348/m.2096 type:complete len:208 (-) Transcript_1348:79-702(-)
MRQGRCERKHPVRANPSEELLCIVAQAQAVGITAPVSYLDGGPVYEEEPNMGNQQHQYRNTKCSCQDTCHGKHGHTASSHFANCLHTFHPDEHSLQPRPGSLSEDHASYKAVGQHKNEILVILEAYTVANPRAVVIHAHHALATNTAVVSSLGPLLLAFFAHGLQPRLKVEPSRAIITLGLVFHQVPPLVSHETWVRAGAAEVTPQG